jgi:tetratricopeptide (TPR) repeat protein
MADVFISYASEDRERARMVATALEASGLTVWWDRKIVAGQSFDAVIERELETSKSVVVLWSKDAIVSEWVKNEAAAAAERGVLVPALIDNIPKIPLEFRRKQTVNLVDWDGEPAHPGFQALREGVIAAATGKTPPPPPPVPAPGFHWNNRWLWVALVVVVVTSGIVYWAITRPIPNGDQLVINQQGVRRDILNNVAKTQREAVELLSQGKREQGIALTDKNFVQIDQALQAFPNDAELHALMGYTLKDMYQSTKGLLPVEKRREYLSRARSALAQALRLDPKNAGAYNGMGNVLFFEGQFDAAIKLYNKALQLQQGNYPAAQDDKELAERVRDGKIPFDF